MSAAERYEQHYDGVLLIKDTLGRLTEMRWIPARWGGLRRPFSIVYEQWCERVPSSLMEPWTTHRTALVSQRDLFVAWRSRRSIAKRLARAHALPEAR
jgi:hypothetical protein